MDTITRETLKEFSTTEEGAKLLRSVCSGIDIETELIAKAIEFVQNPENKAAGLAAPQVGSKSPWFVMKRNRDNSILVVFNPKIIGRIGKKQYVEGCFSEPMLARVKRSKSITVEYFVVTINNEISTSKRVKEVMDGIDAQVFQHEYDHLNGVLICDKGEVIDNG